MADKFEARDGATGVMPAQTGLYYNGGWHVPLGKGQLISANPATGRDLIQVAAADAADLDRAVTAARAAQKGWAAMPPLGRARVLREAAARIRHHKSELALLDALDSGNPVKGMELDVELGVTLMEFFAGLATEIKGETIPVGVGKLNYVQREPIGVVARIVPFNHPLMFVLAKMSAPLIAGNAVIIKPSEETPLSALRVAEIIGDLFPPGVFSVLNGTRHLGEAISQHPGIANVSVVGSVATGRAVMRQGADTLKRVVLELGGKNALIICADADVDKAVAGALKGMNLGWTAGQSCGSTSRVFIHDSLYDDVVTRLSDAFQSISLGDPARPDTQMGCLTTRAQYDKTLDYIRIAEQEGARMAAGGAPDMSGALSDGYFVRPTLFADVTPDMRIASEEVFGPVLSVLRWSDKQAMLHAVNGLELGLTASIWTRDLALAFELVNAVEAGYVWVNNASDHFLGAPFGGVKQSGIGREECLEELLAYTEQKNVSISLD